MAVKVNNKCNSKKKTNIFIMVTGMATTKKYKYK